MFALLNPRLLIAAAIAAFLCASHFYVYRAGKNNVRTEWNLDKARANSEARSLEQARQRRADESAQLAAANRARVVADAAGARRNVDSLRDAIESTERVSQESIAAANNSVRLLGDILQSCSAEYRGMAESADLATVEALELRRAWPK